MDGTTVRKQAACWACGTTVMLPCHNGMYAETYKCGWCGAITSPQKHHHHSSLLSRLLQGVRQLFVCLIWLVLFSVPSLGFSCVLPRLFTGLALFLNTAWASYLAINILFNFAAAILRHPGPVELETGRDANLPAGSFDNCMFCAPCQGAKPIVAHHCRTCVMEMDHHCIFLNSCVGLNNMRHFLLLLLYLTVGCTYTLAACSSLLWQERAAVMSNWSRLLVPILRSGHFWEFFLITPRFLLTAPWWLAGNTYLMAVTGSAVPGIVLLLTSELRLIFRGQSYIESLQGRSPNTRPGRLRALRRVFGCGYPVMWSAMRWHPPPGAAAAALCYKKST